MKSETLKNAAVSSLVGATLVTGVIFLAPGWGDQPPPPAPGPAARAVAAAGSGAPASLAELAALIGDRERWLRAHPRDEESWAVLGSAYVERGSRLADTTYYLKAEDALRRSLNVLSAKDGNVDALVGLAALANARHDFTRARTFGESAMRQKPKRWTVYPVLIDAYSGLGDHKAVSRAMDRLLKLNSLPPVLGRAAEVYRDKGWREDAAAMAYDAMSHADAPTEKASALHRLGELAWERGEPAEAVSQYDAALRAASDHHPSLVGRARALAALGRNDEAFHDYQAALGQVPLPEYYLEAGELYESLGLDGDALTQYELLREHVVRAESHGVNEELVLARFEADHGDATVAVRRLQGEWRRGHRSMYVADAMGWALYRAGRAQAALPFAKKAMDQGLRSALFAYHRGEIERALGMHGPARRHLTEALRTNPRFSPLLAVVARESLNTLGEPPAGGPQGMNGDVPAQADAPESGAGAGTGSGSGTGTGTGSGSGTGTGTGTGTGSGTGSGSGSGSVSVPQRTAAQPAVPQPAPPPMPTPTVWKPAG